MAVSGMVERGGGVGMIRVKMYAMQGNATHGHSVTDDGVQAFFFLDFEGLDRDGNEVIVEVVVDYDSAEGMIQSMQDSYEHSKTCDHKFEGGG